MARATQAVVREAREDDLPRILDLLEQLSAGSSRGARAKPEFGDGHRATLARLRDNPDYHLLVLEEDGEVAGTATLYLLPDMDLGGSVWGVVEHVVVDEPRRGRGHGEALMGEAIRLAKAAGCYKISLNSGKQRFDTHRFYERIGFRSNSKGFSIYP
jgi:GNAT superfamily N-acetyltransferase